MSTFILPAVIFVCALLTSFFTRLAQNGRPDPFLLNLTFFGGIGIASSLAAQVQASKNHEVSGWFFFALFIAFILVMGQIWVFTAQGRTTQEYIREQLEAAGKTKAARGVVHEWSEIATYFVGLDFYPEFFNTGQERSRARQTILDVIPDNLFDKTRLSEESLLVPPRKRRWLWRLYVAVSMATWVVYIAVIVSTVK